MLELDPAPGERHDAPIVGACALDAAAGTLLLGAWRDDDVRLALRTHLTALRPVELVLPRTGGGGDGGGGGGGGGSGAGLSETTRRLLRSALRAPQVNHLALSGGPAASGAAALKALEAGGYYSSGDAGDAAGTGDAATAPPLPPLLAELKRRHAEGAGDSGDAGAASERARLAEAALRALGLMAQFLKDGLLDRALLPHAKFEALTAAGAGAGALFAPPAASSEGGGNAAEGGAAAFPAVGADAQAHAAALDGAALENLELLENSAGGTAGAALL